MLRSTVQRVLQFVITKAGRLAHEQEPREGLARTPEGDRVGITSSTDTEFDRKDKDAYMYIVPCDHRVVCRYS